MDGVLCAGLWIGSKDLILCDLGLAITSNLDQLMLARFAVLWLKTTTNSGNLRLHLHQAQRGFPAVLLW